MFNSIKTVLKDLSKEAIQAYKDGAAYNEKQRIDNLNSLRVYNIQSFDDLVKECDLYQIQLNLNSDYVMHEIFRSEALLDATAKILKPQIKSAIGIVLDESNIKPFTSWESDKYITLLNGEGDPEDNPYTVAERILYKRILKLTTKVYKAFVIEERTNALTKDTREFFNAFYLNSEKLI